MNKFEQVSSDDHQMSVAGGRAGRFSGLMSKGAGAGGPCTVRSNASWVMVTGELPRTECWTDMTENITFLQLRWQVVTRTELRKISQ